MTVPAAISLGTVLLALFLAISNATSFFMRGWEQQRWFALVALSTCVYSGANALLTLPVSEGAIVACSRISIGAAALHVLAWMHYSRRDLEPLGPWPRRLVDAALLLLGVGFSIAGVTGRAVLRPSRLAAVSYRVAETTRFGGLVFGLLMAALLVLAARYAQAAIRRVPYALAHLVALLVLLCGAANDSAMTLGWSKSAYLLDAAFFIAVAILGVILSMRWADDVKALDRALHSRDEFIAIASHELKTPLTPLQLQLQLLQRRVATGNPMPPGWLEEQLHKLQRQVQRLTRLVSELLDFSRLERGTLKLEREPVDLVEVVREAAAQFQSPRPALMRPVIHVQSNGVALGHWDPLRLSQIVVNLIDNALKYGQGKPVDVEVQSSPGAALLSVSDRGIGVAPRDRARIFAKFERGVPVRQYGGLGLGLYITQQIVAALGGTIDVAPRTGGGSTFTVVLPVAGPG